MNKGNEAAKASRILWRKGGRRARRRNRVFARMILERLSPSRMSGLLPALSLPATLGPRGTSRRLQILLLQPSSPSSLSFLSFLPPSIHREPLR